jgi:hypothetical protein
MVLQRATMSDAPSQRCDVVDLSSSRRIRRQRGASQISVHERHTQPLVQLLSGHAH